MRCVTTGLAALVDAAISSAEAGVAKPDPRIFARALELVGGRTAGALHAGDSLENDVAGALAAGLRPVLVARGERPAGVGCRRRGDRLAGRARGAGRVTSPGP